MPETAIDSAQGYICSSRCEQGMALWIKTDTCTSCGRKEIRHQLHSCPGTNFPNQCTSCREERANKHQLSFGKAHLPQQLPHTLVRHIHEFLHQKVQHCHTRRRFLLMLILRGKTETPSNLQMLHGQLAAHCNISHNHTQWYKWAVFGLRSDIYTKLVDLVIGPATMQARRWCPWCHGSGCN